MKPSIFPLEAPGLDLDDAEEEEEADLELDPIYFILKIIICNSIIITFFLLWSFCLRGAITK